MKLGRKIRIDELRRTQTSVLVERGRDNSVLIVAFTGGMGEEAVKANLMLPVYEFFETTKTLGYSRILLRDQYSKHYHRGIDDLRPDFPSLVAYLREEIAALNPQRVLCIGTSVGGYAAIRAGHELRADYVHAFAPQTGDLPPGRPPSEKPSEPHLDLAQILKNWNKKTTYYVHYCRCKDVDRYHAGRLFESPEVVTLGYPCDTHAIAIVLAKQGFLTELLAMANQDRLVEIAKAHFGDSVEINGPQSKKQGRPSRPGSPRPSKTTAAGSVPTTTPERRSV